MKDHNRGRTVEEMINLSLPATRSVLYQLNGKDDIYHIGGHKLYYREPVLRRTVSGRHYRMAPAMAELLMTDIAQPVGAHTTEPPTVLATTEETLIRLEDYVESRELDPRGIANGIREALTLPRR
jgi:hypothetical protein